MLLALTLVSSQLSVQVGVALRWWPSFWIILVLYSAYCSFSHFHVLPCRLLPCGVDHRYSSKGIEFEWRSITFHDFQLMMSNYNCCCRFIYKVECTFCHVLISKSLTPGQSTDGCYTKLNLVYLFFWSACSFTHLTQFIDNHFHAVIYRFHITLCQSHINP